MPQIAFLIDADNLASAAEVEEAFEHLRKLGTVVLRRAYGGHEKLAGIKDVLKRLAVRSFVNQGRGTTDVALVVDTMDLLHHDRLPEMVAIGSSDADFAPLVLRLREAGIQAICFAQREKADAEALQIAYDKVVYLGLPASTGDAAPVAKPARAPRKTRAAVSPAKVAAPRIAAPPAEVEAVLQAAPALRAGKPIRLNEVSKQLRDAKILSKNAKPTALLRKLGQHFELTPETRPSYVQWTGAAGL